MERLLAVAALALSLCAPTSAAGDQRDAALEATVDLVFNAPDCSIGSARNGSPAAAEVILCNAGVDSPRNVLLGTLQVGALFLSRSRATAEPSGKIFSQSDDRLLVDSADLALSTSGGLDITVIAPLNGAIGLEIRYFGIDGAKASREVADPLGTGVRFDGFGTSIAAASQRIDYTSRLYNFEVNVLPQVAEGIPLVVGFRTLQLHERFELWQLGSPESLDLGSHTNNHLYGLQIGAEPYLGGTGGPLRLDGLFKVGIYGNHAVQGTASPLSGSSIEVGRNSAAFVGEVGVAIVYRLNRFMALRGGYELLWIQRVALAPDQSATTNLAVSAATVDLDKALLHGATACVEFAF
jgi:hypothetical protein